MVKRRVRMRLDETDGSACAVLGRFENLAMHGGWTEKELDEVVEEALSGGPEHMMRTIEQFLEVMVADGGDGDE